MTAIRSPVMWMWNMRRRRWLPGLSDSEHTSKPSFVGERRTPGPEATPGSRSGRRQAPMHGCWLRPGARGGTKQTNRGPGFLYCDHGATLTKARISGMDRPSGHRELQPAPARVFLIGTKRNSSSSRGTVRRGPCGRRQRGRQVFPLGQIILRAPHEVRKCPLG